MEHLDWLLTESKFVSSFLIKLLVTPTLFNRLTSQAMQNHVSQLGVDDIALQKPQEVEK